MIEVKLSKDMSYLKCFNETGELIASNGFLELKESTATLRVGASFKQTISRKKADRILDANGLLKKETPKSQPKVEKKVDVPSETSQEVNSKVAELFKSHVSVLVSPEL